MFYLLLPFVVLIVFLIILFMIISTKREMKREILKHEYLEKNGICVIGRIISSEKDYEDSDVGIKFSVEYFSTDGKRHTFSSGIYFHWIDNDEYKEKAKKYSVDAPIRVYYKPSDPNYYVYSID